jgi:hypothetical protein
MIHMLDLFLLVQNHNAPNYFHLTQANRTQVEQLIYKAPRDRYSKPMVTTLDITNILGLSPQCGKRPDNPQITCTWQEGKREIKAYFFSSKGRGMEF